MASLSAWKRSISIIVVSVIVLEYVSGIGILRAEVLTSPNFRIEQSDVDQFGGYSTSTGFTSIIDGGLFTTGSATSSGFSMDMGPLHFDSFTPLSQNWRWYDDESSETPTNALASENTAPTGVESTNIIKLRITVHEDASIGSSNQKFRLQYSTASDFSGGGFDVRDGALCTGDVGWCYADGGGIDNGLITTALLTDADTCVGSVGDGCGTHNEAATSTSASTHAAGANAEYEFTIEQNNTLTNTTYFFRLVNQLSSSTVPLNTGETYPSLVTGGTDLSFSISGISSGASTEGVTTDVTTTPTSVPFGVLGASVEREAAQRMEITTNATNGYKIWAYQRQGLMNERAQEIDPISGTNASPLGWSAGCSGLLGCYGYHTGEDVLDQGSTRFSANDSFAQFSGAAEEVGYASASVTNKTTDMVYKIQVTPEQYDGTYVSSVVYIVTPVF